MVRLWDFASMTKSMNSFKIFTPSEGYVLNRIAFSSVSNFLLIITEGAYIK